MDIPVLAAGDLRHRISLLRSSQPEDTSQPFGQPSLPAEPLNAYATVWAYIDALQGRDLYRAQQFISDVSHTVTVRYLAGIAGGDVVVFGDRRFRVQAVLNPQERNIQLNLLCLEIGDGSVTA